MINCLYNWIPVTPENAGTREVIQQQITAISTHINGLTAELALLPAVSRIRTLFFAHVNPHTFVAEFLTHLRSQRYFLTIFPFKQTISS